MREYEIHLLTEVQHNISNDLSECTEVLSWAFGKLGITYYSYVYIGQVPSEISEAVILGNYPKEWVRLYETRTLFRQDPIIKYSSSTSDAFFWDDVVGETESETIFHMSAPYGIEQGFTVPVHEPGCAFGSMHFASCKEHKEFNTIVQNNAYILSAISHIAHQHRPRLARRSPYKELTEREVECLHWISMGKSYGEIALILNISERTAKFHSQNIINKMDAVNIKQAMAKALRLNLI